MSIKSLFVAILCFTLHLSVTAKEITVKRIKINIDLKSAEMLIKLLEAKSVTGYHKVE